MTRWARGQSLAPADRSHDGSLILRAEHYREAHPWAPRPARATLSKPPTRLFSCRVQNPPTHIRHPLANSARGDARDAQVGEPAVGGR